MTKHTAANPDVFAKVMARLFGTGVLLFLFSGWLNFWRDDATWLFFSQIAVVPVWAVLGARSVAARCITAFMFGPITLVYLIQSVVMPKVERVIPGGLVVAMLSMVLLPATLRVLGYACIHHDQPDRNQTQFQFSIREILGLMTLVAVSVFIVQTSDGFLPMGEPWLLLLFLPGIAAWAVFSLSPLYAVAVILCFLLISTAWNRFDIDWPAVMMYLIGVTSPLVALRSAGFRLRKVSARQRPSSTDAGLVPHQDHA